MDVVTGVFQILAVVVVVGGAAKLVAPVAFATTLRTLGLPGGTAAARTAGLVEVALGVTALVAGSAAAAGALAALYAAFTGVVLLARHRGAESCGCFGQVAAPPSLVHVVVNAASALVAAAAATAGVAGITDVLADQPLAGVPYLVTVATGAWLVVVLDTVGAQLVDEVAAVHRLGPVFRDQARAATVPARAVPRAPRRRSGPTGQD